jgi:two-component system response regulator WspF
VRIGIVNDMRTAVEALRRVVLRVPGYQVAWVAHDGATALELCIADRPDVVLMDLAMPVMDGVTCTRRIMAEAPCAILIVTATVTGAYSQVYEAMGAGALDAVNTPVLGLAGDVSGGRELLAKLETIGRLVTRGPPDPDREPPPPQPRPSETPTMVAIGASTGGPQALVQVLGQLSRDLPVVVAIVQHVDVGFAPGLAEWLTERTGFPVEAVIAGTPARAGHAYLAASNDHLVIQPDQSFGYTAHPRALIYRPSVDVFFRSAAANWPSRSVAALLTGMGRDGAEGMLLLRRAGWMTIAQDQTTCVVYGMPKAAVEMGAATRVLPLPRIGISIARHVQPRARRPTRP